MADAIEPLTAADITADATTQDEERILRHWTPILLRSILIAATIILVIGLFVMAAQAPGAYVARFRAVQAGHVYAREPISAMFAKAGRSDPHAIVTIGLMMLTLVPFARVAFCFLLFIRERDWTYVAFTAYVLFGLILGIVLGRVG
jgi:uncharacterized membrane protein